MSWRDMTETSFHRPPLSESARRNLIAEAKSACKYLVMSATTATTTPIEKVVLNASTGRHMTVRMLRDPVDPKLEGFHAHTRVRATIEEVADFFYIDSPAKSQAYFSVMDDLVMKRCTLYTLVERPISEASSQPLHYVGVDWKVIKSAGGTPRDLCLLDYHDQFSFFDEETQSSRRGWARCIHSVELPCCPDMERRFGLVRSTIVRSGYVFVESIEPGVLDYYKIYTMAPTGGVYKLLPQLFYSAMMKLHSRTVLSLEEHFVERRIKPTLELPASRFQDKKNVDYCMHCYARFNWITIKKQCRACGDVTCQKCSSKWSIHLGSQKHAKVELCFVCVSGMSKEPQGDKKGQLAVSGSHSNVTSNSQNRMQNNRPAPAPSHQNGGSREGRYSDGKFGPPQPAHSKHSGRSGHSGHSGHSGRSGNASHGHMPHAAAAYDNGPSVITIGTSPPPLRSSSSGREDPSMSLHIISPTQWTEVSQTPTSILEAHLSFRSDSSSIHL
ncbi:unnamed protein product [Aphanomyces euteiches]